MIDVNVLDKGMDYKKLKKSFAIFICTSDYFKKDKYMYTLVNQCKEDVDLYLNDETTAIVLNINGTVGGIDEELKGRFVILRVRLPRETTRKRLPTPWKKSKAIKIRGEIICFSN